MKRPPLPTPEPTIHSLVVCINFLARTLDDLIERMDQHEAVHENKELGR